MKEVACRSVLLHALVHANLSDKNLGQIKSREIQTEMVTNVGRDTSGGAVHGLGNISECDANLYLPWPTLCRVRVGAGIVTLQPGFDVPGATNVMTRGIGKAAQKVDIDERFRRHAQPEPRSGFASPPPHARYALHDYGGTAFALRYATSEGWSGR